MSVRRGLYPEIEAYASGMLSVSEVHDIDWEESGHPEGKPVVFVHGGPGAGPIPSSAGIDRWQVL